MSYRINEAGLLIVKRFEGWSATPYICPAGKLTIGYGHVVLPHESFTEITKDEGEDILRVDIGKAERACLRLLNHSYLDENKFSALVSFTFNLGSGRLQSSTLRAKFNRGDIQGAANEFPKWRRSSGKVLTGLVLRRQCEQILFLS